MRLIECVPNFSEGRDDTVIGAIRDAIAAVPAVHLLDVDKGWGAHRTVMTFAGEPEPVAEAAFQAIKTAARVIDMRLHKGAHPRVGATDVCPFVPLAGVEMAQCVELAARVGERVGKELDLPVFLYGEAARVPARTQLPDVRRGQYEGLAERFTRETPDFGKAIFHAGAGATIVGARPILIAFNVNLNTDSTQVASRIAAAVRESGRLARDAAGQPLHDESGRPLRRAGPLKAVRAVGWYVQEHKCAQVSTNVLDFRVIGLQQVYEEIQRQALLIDGVEVTGSELVGMVPLQALLSAGEGFALAQNLALHGERELLELAVSCLGLRTVRSFNPEEKVLEYRLRQCGADVNVKLGL
jgi:glutamate formiminotransferase/formiminotetrahydrofolate cyclodeaminase